MNTHCTIKYSRTLFILIAMCMSMGTVVAQGIDFRRFTLPCGVRVLLHSNPHAPVVSVGLMYRSGLNDQPSNLAGVNDVVENEYFTPFKGRGVCRHYGDIRW